MNIARPTRRLVALGSDIQRIVRKADDAGFDVGDFLASPGRLVSGRRVRLQCFNGHLSDVEGKLESRGQVGLPGDDRTIAAMTLCRQRP